MNEKPNSATANEHSFNGSWHPSLMTRLTLKWLFVFVLVIGSATAAEATLVERAQKGDAAAQFNLGLRYANGKDVPKDSTEAVKWFRKAAEQGLAIAQYSLGVMYDRGEGVAQNSTEAVNWYDKAAEQGLADAEFNLGVMYLIGKGVLENSAEADKWFRKAADQGNADAQFYLGDMYANGNGVPKDNTEAMKWWRKAAEQGNADAQGNLGSMYANGEGVPKDASEGLAWTNIAAASGGEINVKNRDLMERRLGPEATMAAQQRSKQILKEIEAAKRASSSSTPTDSTTAIAPADETPKASGSGAIVSPAGHVLMAAHVVAGARRVKIFTAQGMKAASVLRIDEANDLAVLKLAGGIYLALPVVPSRKVRLGQTVATIGFPNVEIQGFSPKVTRGEISSLNGIGDDPRAWQISVPVQPGNSGGPLLDENGNLVGVVVSKLGLKAAQATGDIPQNVNYAVKSTYALALLEPYLDSSAPEPNQSAAKPRFEDMVAKAQQSVVLILVY
jgi:TPR repeat protein